jgi:predicted RNase H-like nuclease (RuvC/YqgF family)
MNNHIQRLTEDQIAAFQREARKTLVASGYNLFAEITLRLIEHYYAHLAEVENARNLRADRKLEDEFLTRENETLRARVAELERERQKLRGQVNQQHQEIEQLKRKKLNLPPSWK